MTNDDARSIDHVLEDQPAELGCANCGDDPECACTECVVCEGPVFVPYDGIDICAACLRGQDR
jgi:hypothetical protein